MTDPVSFLLGALLAGLLAALAIWLLRPRPKNEPDRLETEFARLAGLQAELAGRLSAMADAQAQAQGELARTLNERLDQVSHRVGASLEETSTKTFETLGNLSARLTAIDEAQKNITELSSQVVGLQDILANPKSLQRLMIKEIEFDAKTFADARRTLIQDLMCRFALDFSDYEKAFAIPFAHYFQPELADLQKLADFRSGDKPASIMHQIAKGYSDEQLEVIAGYFAKQK